MFLSKRFLEVRDLINKHTVSQDRIWKYCTDNLNLGVALYCPKAKPDRMHLSVKYPNETVFFMDITDFSDENIIKIITII